MITLLLATRNAHKAGEIRSILGDEFGYLTLNDCPRAPVVKEDAATFAANATKKSVELAEWASSSGVRSAVRRTATEGGQNALPIAFVLADDSGLEVDALNGAPGVHSARFAALDAGHTGNSSDAENNAKLLNLLRDFPLEKRTARFRCVLALTPVVQPAAEAASPMCHADDLQLKTELFEGVCEGRLDFAPRGQGGFGYDPLFIPIGYQKTFAELGEEVKNQLSHRAKALAKLKPVLESLAGDAGKT